ncbi:CDK-activating kinase assembly factor MAT1-domain-containing protein, partial [Phascolomyces articulosus]
EDAQCPVCKSDKYLTPNLKLLVSPCFHKMCESCIDRLFSAGPAPCPICQQILRKNQFMSQIFEDLEVEKEVRIRKRVNKVFNKRPEDFPSLRLYNDYLEEVEDISKEDKNSTFESIIYG